MKVGKFVLELCFLFLPAAATLAAEKPPHELYDAINALRVDSAAVYHLVRDNRIELRRGDAVLSFEEGHLAFFFSLDGRVTGAVFSGRGHILAMPRDPVEKQQMGLFLGAPVLDQDFVTAYFRFTDTTADDFLRQFTAAHLAPQSDFSFAEEWNPVVARLNPSQTLRILFEMLSPQPKPYFYATLDGASTGPFDLILDARREEQFLLGQFRAAGGKTHYDVWTSHRVAGFPARSPFFRGLQYSIQAAILPDNSLDATVSVRLRALSGTERILVFQLSRALTAGKVLDEHGQSLAFFQNEGVSLQERSTRGNDYLYVLLPQPPAQGQEFTLQFHYRGSVIRDAGNGVLFVGARESWYPHSGDAADFASYDLTLRWPRKLRLVATGTKLDEREDGDFRIGHWKTDAPMAIAGFNLGDYASVSFTSGGRSIDVYANRQLEEALQNRLAATDPDRTPVAVPHGRFPSTVLHMPPAPPPSPAGALKQLGKEVDSSIRFYESLNGPFPFRSLSVSQIPGTFAQGWPGLLYLSTFSFLSSEAQQRAGLTAAGSEKFTELVPYHEVAHQWWGNLVGWSSYRDQWIDEALANYLALLFADTQKNPDRALRIWLARFRQRLLEKSPGSAEPAAEIGALTLGTRLNSSKSPEAYETIIYCKGAWMIHMLREMLRQPGSKNPDSRFAALLQTLAKKYSYGALSTEDLRREVEAVMTPAMDLEGGRSMEWFFDEWVSGVGIPHYRVEFTAHQTEKGYLVRGKLFQSGVPDYFIARVPLYAAGIGHNSFMGTVVTDGPETSFQFLAPALPRKIAIDPQMTLLCTSE